MNLENWFVTPIWYDYLSFDTQLAAKRCLQLREDGCPGRVLSNVGGWQSVNINLTEYPEFQDINQILEERLHELSESINPEYTFKLDNVWVNINDRGNYNQRHVHPTSCFSGTIYLQVDNDTGKIKFFNDFWMIKHYPANLENSNLFCQNVTYTPRNGMMLIFPSWIPHEVTPSNSDLTRISISFNIRQII